MGNETEQAKAILQALGLPKAQQNEMSALTLIALCGIKRRASWSKATRRSLTITKGIMAFMKREYNKSYAPNTRETVRRQVLHQFVQAGLVDYNPEEPDLPTNSPRAHYAVSETALTAIRSYGTRQWRSASARFLARRGSLIDIYQRKRRRRLVPVRLPDGRTIELSPGTHNALQAAIIEEFGPRFAPGAYLLYLGDTARKTLFLDETQLTSLRVQLTKHDKLPDVVLHDAKRNWLFLIEAVTSHGPVSPKRLVELQAMVHRCRAGAIFVSAFPTFAEFRRHLTKIAWETEVWIAEMPDHLIHYNGDRFFGPR